MAEASPELLDHLRSSSMFEALTDEQLVRVAALGDEREVPRGTLLGEPGKGEGNLYLVIEGVIGVPSVVGTRSVLMVTAPETYGNATLLPPYTYITRGITSTDCRLLVFRADVFRDFLDRETGIGARVYRAVATILAERFAAAIGEARGQTTGNYVSL